MIDLFLVCIHYTTISDESKFSNLIWVCISNGKGDMYNNVYM